MKGRTEPRGVFRELSLRLLKRSTASCAAGSWRWYRGERCDKVAEVGIARRGRRLKMRVVVIDGRGSDRRNIGVGYGVDILVHVQSRRRADATGAWGGLCTAIYIYIYMYIYVYICINGH